MKDDSKLLPGDNAVVPHNPKNDLDPARRIATPENLRYDVRSACRQLDNIREQCELRLTLKGQRVLHDEAFITSFVHTVAVAMHRGWREECQVLAVVLHRNSRRFQCRTTIASIELRAAVVGKVLAAAEQPFDVVPLRSAPLESLLVLIPAGKAEPQWATSITDGARLRSILKSLLDEYRGQGGAVLAVDPAGGLLM